jgi:hypothetical protein
MTEIEDIKRKVLTTLFGPKSCYVTKAMKKLHNEEIHNCTPHLIIKVFKLRRIIRAGHVVRNWEMRDAYTKYSSSPIRH